MKILIADKFEESGINGLQELGCELVYDPASKGETLVAAIRDSQADVLVVRSTEVNEAILDAGRLSLIVRAGAGFNTIDVKAASARGIYVSNCPGRNAVAVAELAFGLICALDGATLGLIGLGQIGREMIPRARAFGMNVIGWSRRLTPDSAAETGIAYRQTIQEVANDCDIISIHLALTPETR